MKVTLFMNFIFVNKGVKDHTYREGIVANQ